MAALLRGFSTYLANTAQFVSICGTKSEVLPVDYGVVQGSNNQYLHLDK